jgi:hypothetical protein
MPLLELVKPDKTKPARLYRDPNTGQIILEYTGEDLNIYRVPVSLVFLPQEFADLARQLSLTNLLTIMKTIIVGVITVFIVNGLDQAVNVQVVGCRDRGCSDSVDVGSVVTVPAGSKDARTLTPETSGWLPFITVRVWCSTAPTSGAVSVWLVRSAEDQVLLVDSLAIRDTATHTFATDPTKIFVREW